MRLTVLGPTELVEDGAVRAAGPPKQRVLLTALAMNADRVVSIDALTERVWPEGPPASAHGSLQVYVSNLRRVLEREEDRGRPRRLVSAGDGYGLMTQGLELDVRELEQHVQAGRDLSARGEVARALGEYDAALALWRGDSYADVRHAEWAQPEIARVEELRLTATDERAALLLGLGRASEVATTMEAVVGANPLREASWELLVLAYARAARQADALAALRRVRSTLADELGIDPGPRLRQLETAVLRQEVDEASVLVDIPTTPGTPSARTRRAEPLTAGSSGSPPESTPFVGRQRHLETLRRAVAEAQAGRTALVLVDGEPGVGKTRLLEELAASSPEAVAWGRSPDHEAVPALWPWGQVLHAVAMLRPDHPVPDDVTAFVAGRGDRPPVFDAEGARLREFERVTDYVRRAVPLTVLLEDVHAADGASLRLLEHLADAHVPGLAVVATDRRHEASHLTSVLSRLARAGADRISLDGLDLDDVRALVTATTGSDPGTGRAADLHVRTGGNPFFLSALARDEGPVPASVGDVVRHRVERLGGGAVTVLESAAVVGDEAEAWLVAEVADCSLDEAVASLDAAYEAGLITTGSRPSSVRFTHSLVVDALLDRRSPPWKAARHLRCATALTRARGDREELHPAIARHWLAAAELGPDQAAAAAEFCGRAARSAARRLAHEDAVTLWEEALAADALAGSPASTRYDLALGLAAARYAAGRYDEGFAAVEMALAAAGDDPVSVVVAVDAAVAHGIWIPFRFGTMPAYLPHTLDAALDRLPEDAPHRARGLALRAVLAGADGREAEVDPAADLAVAAARHTGDPELMRRVLHLRLIALRGQDFIEQRAATARVIRALPDLTEPLAVIADLHLANYDVERGNVPEARRRLGDIQRRARALRDPTLLRQVASMEVGLAIFTGHYQKALAILDALATGSDHLDPVYFRAAELGQRAVVMVETGRLGDFLPVMEQAYAATDVPGFGFGLGLARFATGDVDGARRLLVTTPMPSRDYTWLSAAATRLLLALEVGDLGVVRVSRDLFEPFSGQLAVTGTTTNVFGAYDGHLGEASLALGEVDRARRELTAAVRLLERNGAAYWLVRARQALANCA
ncbi:MAG TPA: BTAD domain-containing putative transcriptional regulator [Lapillicoccus sp.]